MESVDRANKLALANHEDMDAIQANIIAEIQAVRLDVKKELNKTIWKLKNELIDIREEVSAKLNNIASELKETTDRVEAMEQRVADMEDCNAAEALTYTLELQQTLQAQPTDLEAHSHRNNIHIHGIPEGAEGNNMKTFLEKFFKNELSLADTPQFGIQRCHRTHTHLQERTQRSFETYYKNLYTQPHAAELQNKAAFLTSLNLPSIGTEQNRIMT